MQTSIEVITEAKEVSLLTLHDAKLGLNLLSSTLNDDQIGLMVKWASSEIAKLCNRVLAKETLIETILELEAPRIYLSHYPIKEISEISEAGTILTVADYNLDAKTGKLTRAGGVFWGLPTVIKYTGGYDLPQKAPPELASAALLVTREAYHAALRGDASIRMVSHKNSRIMFFDPNAAAKAGATGGSAARRAITDLIRGYTRFEV
jgi:hypothetical protein